MYATEGIVLKEIDLGEADALYALYTRDFGKITARAQGIRKNGAKLRGHLEPLSLSAVRLVRGKNDEKLIGATLVRFWEHIRSRETTIRLAAYVAARVDEHCFAGERDDALWRLIVASFEALDRTDFPVSREVPFVQEFDTSFSLCLGHGDGMTNGERAYTPMAKEAGTQYYI